MPTFAFDVNMPDRIYLANTTDFETMGISLVANFADREVPLMFRKDFQLAPQAALPAPGIVENEAPKLAPAGAKD